MSLRGLRISQGAASAKRRLNSNHWIYLLLYTLLFVVGILCVQTGGSLFAGIGASLIAASLAGWVLFLLVFLDQEESRKRKVITELGLVDAFAARSSQIKIEYDQRLAGARQSIDILGFGLRQLREDYLQDFATWTSRATVRILLLDPSAPVDGHTYAEQRDGEEGNDIGQIASDVRTFLDRTETLRTANPDRLQIRLYTSLPSINIFRVDNELFWGPYLVNSQSRNTPTFVVRRGGDLYDRLLDHFEAIWKSSKLSHAAPAPASPPAVTGGTP